MTEERSPVAEEVRERRKSAVDNLERLYTIVVVLALGKAVEAFLADHDRFRFSVALLAPFIAFVATLIPFYHGANRYLFSAYVFGDYGAAPRRMAALVDLLFFLVQAMIFFAMAIVITEPVVFFSFLVGQLLWDCIWIAVVHWLGSTLFPRILPWARLNIVTGACMAAVLIHPRLPGNQFLLALHDDTLRWCLLGVIAVGRTVLDYHFNWDFYWPTTPSETRDV